MKLACSCQSSNMTVYLSYDIYLSFSTEVSQYTIKHFWNLLEIASFANNRMLNWGMKYQPMRVFFFKCSDGRTVKYKCLCAVEKNCIFLNLIFFLWLFQWMRQTVMTMKSWSSCTIIIDNRSLRWWIQRWEQCKLFFLSAYRAPYEGGSMFQRIKHMAQEQFLQIILHFDLSVEPHMTDRHTQEYMNACCQCRETQYCILSGQTY